LEQILPASLLRTKTRFQLRHRPRIVFYRRPYYRLW
jgi:hypothetical protein